MDRIRKTWLVLTRAERRLAVLAVLAAVLAGTFLAGLAVSRATKLAPARGGQYIEGMVGQPLAVNPVLAASEIDKGLTRLLFANLYDLAEKIDVEENGRVWSVRLKEGLLWADPEENRKITSDDVIFTIQSVQDRRAESPLAVSWNGVTANRMSELELRLTLTSPYPFFGETLRNFFPIPKHVFADVPPQNWKLSPHLMEPLGSGPYRITRIEQDKNGFVSRYLLGPNPRYAGEPPFIEELVIRFFPNREGLLKAFTGGVITGFAEFDPEVLGDLRRSHQTIAFPTPSYYAVFLNQSEHPAFKDIAVRQALAQAVDRAALVERVFRGNAAPVTRPLPATGGDAGAEGFSKDTAQKLLEEAGWTTNDRGVRAKGNTALEFTLVTPELPFLMETAEFVRDEWTKIGVRATVTPVPPVEIVDRVIRNRAYESLLFGNFLRPAEDLYAFWHSDERFSPGLNLALYANPRADRLLEAIRRNPDDASRARELQELTEILVEDTPAVFLYSPFYLMITSKEVRGARPEVLAELADRLRGANRWYVRTARTLK